MAKKNSSKKILSKISLSVLVFTFIIQLAMTAVLPFIPITAQAATPNSITLQVPIGNLSSLPMGNSTKPIADYIKAIYNYAVGAVGIVAAVVLMIGGVTWITAGGNTSSVSEAKSMITAALTGMVLVLTSYLLLDQINPALVDLQADIIQPVPSIPVATTLTNCNWKNISLFHTNSIPNGGSYQSTDAGNCSDFQLAESAGGKDCDASKYPTDPTIQQYTKCCCTAVATQTASAGTGQCAEVTTGSCSSANMSTFGSVAAQASAICQGESGGSPGIPSGTDICADGNPASWGLFQINITANSIGGYDCPSAFSGGAYTASNHNCQVIDQALYNNCVAAAKDPATNIQAAYGIHSNAGTWKPWGFYTRNCWSAF
jgi:hypothetical protein